MNINSFFPQKMVLNHYKKRLISEFDIFVPFSEQFPQPGIFNQWGTITRHTRDHVSSTVQDHVLFRTQSKFRNSEHN